MNRTFALWKSVEYLIALLCFLPSTTAALKTVSVLSMPQGVPVVVLLRLEYLILVVHEKVHGNPWRISQMPADMSWRKEKECNYTTITLCSRGRVPTFMQTAIMY